MSEELHLYTNDEHTVVAASLEEARQKWDEWTITVRDGEDDDDWEEMHEIYQIADGKLISIWTEDELEQKPEGLSVERESLWVATAKAWAESQQRGYLCSTE